MSAEEVAKAFVQHFYQTFDAGVDALGGLFVSLLITFTWCDNDNDVRVYNCDVMWCGVCGAPWIMDATCTVY